MASTCTRPLKDIKNGKVKFAESNASIRILLTYLVYMPELRKLLDFDYVIWGASSEKQKPTAKGDILVKSPTFYDLGKLSNVEQKFLRA